MCRHLAIFKEKMVAKVKIVAKVATKPEFLGASKKASVALVTVLFTMMSSGQPEVYIKV